MQSLHLTLKPYFNFHDNQDVALWFAPSPWPSLPHLHLNLSRMLVPWLARRFSLPVLPAALASECGHARLLWQRSGALHRGPALVSQAGLRRGVVARAKSLESHQDKHHSRYCTSSAFFDSMQRALRTLRLVDKLRSAVWAVLAVDYRVLGPPASLDLLRHS